MELVRDVSLVAIVFLLLSISPLIDAAPGPSDSSFLQNIDASANSIDSDTDGISDLLTKSRFDSEDFAQENTLTSIRDLVATENSLRDVVNSSNTSAFVLDSIYNKQVDRARVTTATRAQDQTDIGKLFISSHVENDVSAGGTVYYIIETSDSDPAQTRFDVTSTGAIQMNVYEGGNYTTTSQGVLVENAKRNSDNIDSYNSTWYNTTDPGDITGFGERIESLISSSGATAGPGTAGAVSSGAKWIFKRDTTYIVEVVNIDSNTIDVGLAADFYEQPVLN